jgi:hypothetical protein
MAADYLTLLFISPAAAVGVKSSRSLQPISFYSSPATH